MVLRTKSERKRVQAQHHACDQVSVPESAQRNQTLVPGLTRWGNFSFLQHYHKLGDRSYA